MKKKPRTVHSQELTILDEAVVIPDESPTYVLVLDDDDVEKLAAGRVSRQVMDRAYGLLSWKREAAQQWDLYQEPPRVLPRKT